MSNYEKYRTLVFDCDGVILNSNTIKTEAFRQVCQPFGHETAEKLVAYHVQHGGVSRYAKFAYLLNDLLHEPATSGRIEELALLYSETVYEALLACQIAEGLDALRNATTNSRWMIVSGGDQDELRRLFSQRDIAELFDGGIFGSPDNKDEILSREIESGNMSFPALFLGDSRYDHEAAKKAGLDFVFLSGWTEFHDWRDYIAQHQLPAVESVQNLLSLNLIATRSWH